MKKRSTQAGDRERVLAAIRVAQKFNDTEEAAARLETESGEVYERMVEGKDLKGLRALKKILGELRPTFKGSTGFRDILNALKARIEDEEEMPNPDIGEAARLAEARRTGVMTVLDNLRATGYDPMKIVEDHLSGKPVGPIESYRTEQEGEQP